jgi:threonine dehydrogenase-like Zn-dependent dehydrogenase
MPQVEIARQFWIEAPGRGVIVRAPLPPAGDGDVLVHALYSGISRGTESIVFRGEVPPSQYDAMRAPFQEGDFPAPVKYGYASVGRLADTPAARQHGVAGRTVFCLHPHQDAYIVPSSAVTPLPDDVPPARAVLAANMETALNATWDARPAPGDRIVVIGGGVVGCLVAWLCRRIPGTDVTLVDVRPSREQVVRQLGLTFRAEAPRDANVDLVVHASGNPSGLVAALAAAGAEATILELSWYGSSAVTLPLGEAFHSRRLTIRSSQVGHIAPDRARRWTRSSRLALALRLLADPALDVLITGESPFEELPDVMAALSRDAGDTLCHRIRY